MESSEDEERGERRYIIDARRLRMRVNPKHIYILQNCARVVRSGQVSFLHIIFITRLYVYILRHPVTIIYRNMQCIAYIYTCITSLFSAPVSMCIWTGSVILPFNCYSIYCI